MRSTRCLPAAIVLVALTFHPVATAQDRIDSSIVGKKTPLTRNEKQTVGDFVDRWVSQLTSGTSTDLEVADGVKHLAAALRVHPSNFFLIEFRAALAAPLRNALKSQRDIVRINVMIVAEYLADAGNIGLLVDGLADKSPAVRYWAAKAVATVAETYLNNPNNQNPQLQKDLLKAIIDAMKVEQSEYVMQHLMHALSQLTIPEAANELLKALDERVAIHFKNPAIPVEAESDALRQAMIRIIKQHGEASNQEMRLLTLVSARYLILVSTLLDRNVVPEKNVGDYTELLTRAVENLRRLVVRLGVKPADLPKTIENDFNGLVRSKNWLSIKLHGQEWERLLIDHIGFKKKDLTIGQRQNHPDDSSEAGVENE